MLSKHLVRRAASYRSCFLSQNLLASSSNLRREETDNEDNLDTYYDVQILKVCLILTGLVQFCVYV